MNAHTARERFRELHRSEVGFILPNPWDVGSARLLAALGFEALATTSSGYASVLGRPDGRVGREEAIAHVRELVQATELPVSADLENGYAAEPEAVAATIELADSTGLAGCSIEDWDRDAATIYPVERATERIRAAVEATRRAEVPLVMTARAENHLRGRDDLADTIARLQAYQGAGAEVLYAPGLSDLGAIRSLVSSVDRPVNVLLLPGGPKLAELFEVGVKRVSLGGALKLAADAALVAAARELLDAGSHTFWSEILPVLPQIRAALRA